MQPPIAIILFPEEYRHYDNSEMFGFVFDPAPFFVFSLSIDPYGCL